MSATPDDPGASRVRYWPPGTRYPDEELIDADCARCGTRWRAHADLAGAALACGCGAAVRFAALPVPAEAAFLAFEAQARGGFGDLDARPSPPPDDVSTSLAFEDGALVEAGARLRSRWTNRLALELGGVLLGFLAPAVAVHFAAEGETRALLTPVASLVGALLVLAVTATARRAAYDALRVPQAVHALEGLLIGAGAALLAIAYVALLRQVFDGLDLEFDALRDVLGTALTLFVVSFCPAVFEEIAFRGLLQSRVSVLFGTGSGILASGLVFGLAHGMTLGLPFHVGLGVYLGWLRVRSGSLVPGMVLHAVYNGILVLTL